MELFRAEERAAFYADAYGEPTPDPTRKAVYNVGLSKNAGYVGKNYHVVQHEDLRQGARQVFANLGIDYDERCSQQGNRMYLDYGFPDTQVELKEVGEQFATGIRIINSYDGTTGVMVLTRFVRLACSNGMVIKSFGQSSFVVKHNNKQLAEDLQPHLERAIHGVIAKAPNLQKMVSDSMQDSIEWECVEKIMAHIIGRKKHMDEIKKRLEGGPINRWTLYNAITDYATHGEQIKPHIEAWLQTKAEKVLTTDSAKLMPIEVQTE